jgi:hypothetical protein
MSRRAANQPAQRAVQVTDVARGWALRSGLGVFAVAVVDPMRFGRRAASWGTRPRAAAMNSTTRPPGGNAAGRHESATHWPTGERALRRGRR